MKKQTIEAVSTDRRGATLVLVLFLLTLFMIGVAFSVDLARVQLAQVELQSVADLSARAGAEAVSRGVGNSGDVAAADAAIRDEIAMIAELNRVGGSEIDLVKLDDVAFGNALQSGQAIQFVPTANGGGFDMAVNAVQVHPKLPNFPVFFGAFVGTDSLSMSKQAAAIVQERDIVLVLDRSASMLDHDASEIHSNSYHPNLLALEDDLYGPGDDYFPGNSSARDDRHSEFEISGSMIQLSKIQALKQAVLNFRREIDASRGREQLGLVTYAGSADRPSDAETVSAPVDIRNGLDPSIRSAIVGNGKTDPDTVHYASALESQTTNYRNFDYNFLAMRWQERTNIADGLKVGAEVLFGTGHRTFAKPVMVLMTDGRHTGSSSPEAALATIIADHPDMTLYTISFGDNADTGQMQRLAQDGGGKWYHITDFAGLNIAFREIARTAGVTLIE